MKSVRAMVFMGLFIALEIIMTRFLSIQTPIVRIGFTFLPIAISAMMFGPLYSGITAAIADILGMMIFPFGAFFPGFTITAFLSGVVYGLLLYQKPKNFVRIGAAVLIVCVILNLGLDSVWLWIITGKGFLAILPARIIKCILMIPLQIVMIQLVWKYLLAQLDQNLLARSGKA